MQLKDLNISELAGYICQTLKDNNIDAVLVGGTCVSLYTESQYLSYDLDIVSYETIRKIKMVLHEIGFEKQGKYFIHPDTDFYIDIVSPPVSIGDQPIHQFAHIRTSYGEIKCLTATDCVKDRLASYYHWNDTQSLEHAVLITQKQRVDLKDIKQWSASENQVEKWKRFDDLIK